MSRAKINPEILRWAKERASVDNSQIAEKLGVKEEYIDELVKGKDLPTFRQAQEIARFLHIPLGYLFLSAPPSTTSPVADFRTLPGAKNEPFSLELEDTLNDALRKRDWLHDWRIQEGFDALPFVGKFNLQSPIPDIANSIRDELAIPLLPDKSIRSWNDQLGFLIHQSESVGILVLQNGVALSNNKRPLSVEEFRGFTFVDAFAPVIFINSRDSISGRIFTLTHELAHLWSGTSGISNPSLSESAGEQDVERFCNKVAAELLVPKDVFSSQWVNARKPDLFEKSEDLAQIFRVSVLVIIIRALEIGLIDKEAYKTLYAEAKRRTEPTKKYSSNGGNFFYTMRVRNGRVFVQDLMVALRGGSVLRRDAALLLNVQTKTIEVIMNRF